MSASDHLGEQMRLFMTAGELHATHSIEIQQSPESRFGMPGRSMSEMWDVKRRENKRSGLKKDVAAHGVQHPVELVSGQDVEGTVIYTGHHRVQAAFEHNPESYVPVEHHDLDKRGF